LATFPKIGTKLVFNNDKEWGGEMRRCDHSIKKTLELAERMFQVADEGDRHREDNGCGVLYGVVRDAAFKIKKLAEAEKEAHIRKGWWKEDNFPT